MFTVSVYVVEPPLQLPNIPLLPHLVVLDNSTLAKQIHSDVNQLRPSPWIP